VKLPASAPFQWLNENLECLDCHLGQDLPRESERQRHVISAQRCHDADVLCWLRNKVRLLGMAGVNRVPVVGDVEVGGLQEIPQVADYKVVYQGFVEDIGSEAVFVRVAHG